MFDLKNILTENLFFVGFGFLFGPFDSKIKKRILIVPDETESEVVETGCFQIDETHRGSTVRGRVSNMVEETAGKRWEYIE